jgi:zinc/manganese transport system substrate-binding protein
MIKYIIASILLAMGTQAEELRLASFHPLATDLARQVGGEDVEVIEIMKPGQDPHSFMPSPSDLAALENTQILLIMGKGLETYIDMLEDNLQSEQSIYEVGRMVPSLRMEDDMTLFACCPSHAHSAIDPHWWHNPRNMERAATMLAKELGKAIPAKAKEFKARAKDYAETLNELHEWAQAKLKRIPTSNRKLITAHAAFNYFCSEYRFRAAPILGLSSLEQPQPGQVRHIIDKIKEEKTPAIFPEQNANPGILKEIAREAGVIVGEPLYAGTPDATHPTYDAMFRHNIESIANALKEEE